MENRLNITEHKLDRLTDIVTRLAEDQQRRDESQQNAWKAIDTLAQTMVTTNLKLESLATTVDQVAARVDQLAATVDRFIRG